MHICELIAYFNHLAAHTSTYHRECFTPHLRDVQVTHGYSLPSAFANSDPRNFKNPVHHHFISLFGLLAVLSLPLALFPYTSLLYRSALYVPTCQPCRTPMLCFHHPILQEFPSPRLALPPTLYLSGFSPALCLPPPSARTRLASHDCIRPHRRARLYHIPLGLDLRTFLCMTRTRHCILSLPVHVTI